jgi:hypothetical protein
MSLNHQLIAKTLFSHAAFSPVIFSFNVYIITIGDTYNYFDLASMQQLVHTGKHRA